MTQEDKSTLIGNCFKLIIGIILLLACFIYLNNHPAEQIALYSWVKNIAQKVEIFSYNIIWKNGDLLSKKFELESKYVEMMNFAEEKWCNQDFVYDMHQTYETLLQEENNNVENYITRYTILAADYELSLYNECDE